MARVQVDNLMFLGGRRWKKGVYESFPDSLVDSLPTSAVVLEKGQQPLSDSDFRAAAVARAQRRMQLDREAIKMRRAAEMEVEAKLKDQLAKLYADEVTDPQAKADAKKAMEKEAVKELTEKKKAKTPSSVKLTDQGAGKPSEETAKLK